MDIKSKNIRYSTRVKAIAVFLLWVCFAGIFCSMVFFDVYSDDISNKSYYDTYGFLNSFKAYCQDVVDYAVILKNENNIKERYKIMNPGPADSNAGAGNGKNAGVVGTINNPYDNYDPYAVYVDQGDKYKELMLFRYIKELLSKCTNLRYIVYDRGSDTLTTNMALKNYKLHAGIPAVLKNELKSQGAYLHLANGVYEASSDQVIRYTGHLINYIKGTSFELIISVKSPLYKDDVFYSGAKEFKRVHGLFPLFIFIILFSIALLITCIIFLTIVSGRREKGGKIRLAFIDRLYNDISIVFYYVIFAFIVLEAIKACISGSGILADLDYMHIGEYVILIIVLSIGFLLPLSLYFSIVRHIKNRTLFRHTLVYVLIRAFIQFIKRCLHSKFFKVTILFFLLGYGILNVVLFMAMMLIGESGDSSGVTIIFILVILFNAASLYFASKAMASLSDIMAWVKGISEGKLDDTIVTRGISAAFTGFVSDIRNMQSGLKNAVMEAVKGERLKTELITNVSHDLKTPLTSIINYVDLLKNEDAGSEAAREYVAVLEEKSGRLKQLVDDLLEASKIASGNISVVPERIDLHSLAEQAVAEYSEKTAAAGLEMRVKAPGHLQEIVGDGKLMWRIMDNLLSNVVKYSQSGTRVYIDIENAGKSGTVTIKNISSSPLDIPTDQLLERFVRGDRSRTTEGSGLGLSIAKNLAEVQGGSLDVGIDGDLFKVTVSIPIADI